MYGSGNNLNLVSAAQSAVDAELFEDIPPRLCKGGLGGALMRIGCDDEGYPVIEDTTTPEPARWRGEVVKIFDIYIQKYQKVSP